MLDYKKTEDMERMKAEAVKRLKWPKIPELNEAFAKRIVMVSDGTNGDVKLRNLFMDEENFKKSYTQVYVENLDYPDCSEIGIIGIECTDKGIIRTF